ncbi:MAG: class I SAM-dependent methyltransferase [Bacteriovorax sp.]
MKNLFSRVLENFSPDDLNCRRLFHGRGGQCPEFQNIVVDYFPPTLLITLYKETPSEQLVPFLDFPASNVLVQKRYLPRPELEVLKGAVPEQATASENGMTFNLKFGTSQNIGFFLDMALGREWLVQHSRDKKVLNLFAYTCSLSVAALKGGARGVVNIDMSKSALSVGKENHLLNGIDLRAVNFFSYDIMKSWNNLLRHGPYDIVIIDPPTNQGESFKVERDYYKIVKRLDGMTNDQAEVLACLNSPHLSTDFLKRLFLEHAPQFKCQEIIPSAIHAMEKNPEEGLKIVLFKKIA